MTECIQSRLAFASEGKREVIAEFNGGTISSDGGALLLRAAEGRMQLLGRLSQCFLASIAHKGVAKSRLIWHKHKCEQMF